MEVFAHLMFERTFGALDVSLAVFVATFDRIFMRPVIEILSQQFLSLKS